MEKSPKRKSKKRESGDKTGDFQTAKYEMRERRDTAGARLREPQPVEK
jgi:hypothetical protein